MSSYIITIKTDYASLCMVHGHSYISPLIPELSLELSRISPEGEYTTLQEASNRAIEFWGRVSAENLKRSIILPVKTVIITKTIVNDVIDFRGVLVHSSAIDLTSIQSVKYNIGNYYVLCGDAYIILRTQDQDIMEPYSISSLENIIKSLEEVDDYFLEVTDRIGYYDCIPSIINGRMIGPNVSHYKSQGYIPESEHQEGI